MPTPTIPDGELFFNATTYTGNGGTQTITNGVAGQSFQPDFVWAKQRNGTAFHALFDSVRGATLTIQSNTTTAEQTFSTALTSFNSNGFTSGSSTDTNQSGQSYVAWQWKAGGAAVTNTAGTISSQVSANTTSGFSVITYTGPGAGGGTVGHGLGVAPSMIIVKNRSASESWRVGHSFMNNGSSPWSYYMNLNATGGQALESSIWNNTAPTSSVFTIANDSAVSGSGNLIVAYCFAQIAGYSAFGSYTGNGSADGTFVYTGFRPRFVMIKVSSGSTGPWNIIDTARDPFNLSTKGLYADLADAEDSSRVMDILSNGFKFRGTPGNTSGATFIYMAFCENPLKYANAR
jgi:hypothetical protein